MQHLKHVASCLANNIRLNSAVNYDTDALRVLPVRPSVRSKFVCPVPVFDSQIKTHTTEISVNVPQNRSNRHANC